MAKDIEKDLEKKDEEVKEDKKAETKKEEVKEEVKKETKGPKTYMVYTPVKDFVGEVAGVHFAYGKAQVKAGWVLDWFKEKGYKVEEIKEAK